VKSLAAGTAVGCDVCVWFSVMSSPLVGRRGSPPL
jgi:hypothetical protein